MVNIQQVFGLIPNVYCQGRCAKASYFCVFISDEITDEIINQGKPCEHSIQT